MNRTVVVAAAAVVVCCGLSGCAGFSDEKVNLPRTDLNGAIISPANTLQSSSVSDMPPWIDLYREKKLVNVSSVDHVVIVTFETQAGRDEFYYHYFDRFNGEENFSSFRYNRDIISFVRDGYGIKITLLDSTKNLWSLEYHRQMI
ncbi:hypothetical protein NY406_03305 [Chlorobaculum sp. MV4-Y]|jgi:hypothetical protein|uniref:hypothetical protein n=1 Tax=Chlorobaculum sp. MV4-Y TaxID=2976335 RepID=UPI0021AF7038|nr:hypothetical protein [Chlorobaculum sp. MV4-Y]UWX58314.1 hypothetical protein NY406_03305 [Chlorobaculum sp. MV4-Y]